MCLLFRFIQKQTAVRKSRLIASTSNVSWNCHCDKYNVGGRPVLDYFALGLILQYHVGRLMCFRAGIAQIISTPLSSFWCKSHIIRDLQVKLQDVISQISSIVGQNTLSTILETKLAGLVSQCWTSKAVQEEVIRILQLRKDCPTAEVLAVLLRPFQEDNITRALPKVWPYPSRHTYVILVFRLINMLSSFQIIHASLGLQIEDRLNLDKRNWLFAKLLWPMLFLQASTDFGNIKTENWLVQYNMFILCYNSAGFIFWLVLRILCTLGDFLCRSIHRCWKSYTHIYIIWTSQGLLSI